MNAPKLDEPDRRIINALQGGFPVCERPYARAAESLKMAEEDLVRRIGRMLDDGVVNRFGPIYNAERMGGAVTLAAMRVPEDEFDTVAEAVNAHPEVAHNYARDHDLNMWMVLSSEEPGRIPEVISEIEAETGLAVFNLPKIEEFYVGLRFEL